jgi:hypothetical protein
MPPRDLVGVDESAEPLRHNGLNQATGGIWRAVYAGRPAILKILTPGRQPDGAPGAAHWATGDDPRHWNYWRRELLA